MKLTEIPLHLRACYGGYKLPILGITSKYDSNKKDYIITTISLQVDGMVQVVSGPELELYTLEILG